MSVHVAIQLPKGQDKQVIRKLMEETAYSVSERLNIPPECVHVRVEEVALDHYSVAGKLLSQ